MAQFKPQKGEHIRKVTEPLQWPFLGSIKLDGIRSVTYNGGTLTYSLKDVPNKHIRDTLAPWQHLDGEIIVGAPNLDSTFNTTTSAVRTIAGKPDFHFFVFDDISEKALKLPFEDRLDMLYSRELPSFITAVEQFSVNSMRECEDYYEYYLNLGYEGLMLRKAKSMYKFGRCTVTSQDCLKMKPEDDDEAVVLEVLQGSTNTNNSFLNEHGRTTRSTHQSGMVPSGLCGGLRCRDVKTGLEFVVAPGKMSHAERKAVWRRKALYEGRICKYRHMPVGVLSGGLPRMPRWIGWREIFDFDLYPVKA